MSNFSRRNFLKTSALGGAVLAAGLPKVHAAENDGVLKVALVGCGGRGRGAAANTLNADKNVKIVAVADAFEANAKAAAEGLQAQFEDRADLKDGVFWGLDAYKQAIDKADVALLCETPAFRARSLRYAVDNDKHAFAEKPVATDAAGIRSVLESTEIAKKKGLTLVSGLCWRYDLNVKDMMQRILDGAIGDITSARMTYLTGKLWTRPRQEGDTEMMFQVRNWYNYAWLSGDFNVEQHVHTLDKALWAMGDAAPATCYGLGGRMQRVEQPAYGDIYDSMAAVFEYPNGTTVYSLCRQQNGCWGENNAHFSGTKGHATVLGGARITDLDGKVVYEQKKVPSDMYTLEHVEMYKSIRGKIDTINNGEYMAKSTMMGIMAREACYTGAKLKWDDMMKSEKSYAPSAYAWDGTPWNVQDEQGRYKVQVPGLGQVYHTVAR